jgi:nicotinamide mononucleotide (NMN) deamidase PncC
MRLITIMKTFTIVAALVASGTSLAMAETGYGGPNGSQQLVTAPAGGPAYAP